MRWASVCAAILTISLSACGKVGETTCSSDNATAAAVKLVTEAIEKRADEKSRAGGTITLPDNTQIRLADESAVRAALNLLKVTITEIRTTKNDPNSTKKFCTGTLKIVAPLGFLADAERTFTLVKSPSVSDQAAAAGVQRGADTFTVDFDYTVQPTDDKKDVVAEADNQALHADFFSELVLAGALKSKVEGLTQQAQAAQQQKDAEQAAVQQQARQADLDQARAENKLSVQSINAAWGNIDHETRLQIVDVQRAWIKSKDANCRLQAAGASTEPTEIEIARLHCDTAANQGRMDWLRQYQPQ
jgi:uncharacterized protein YecT (DUF1311 family)